MLKCPNCSAPVSPSATPVADYRHCPACRRQLLALGSPACSYCGRRLPDEFIKARESDMHRISNLQNLKADLPFSKQNHRRDVSLADLLTGNLTDLFS